MGKKKNILIAGNKVQRFSFPEARENLKGLMRQTCDTHSPVAITEAGGKSVVLMSLDDFRILKETDCLLKDLDRKRSEARNIDRTMP